MVPGGLPVELIGHCRRVSAYFGRTGWPGRRSRSRTSTPGGGKILQVRPVPRVEGIFEVKLDGHLAFLGWVLHPHSDRLDDGVGSALDSHPVLADFFQTFVNSLLHALRVEHEFAHQPPEDLSHRNGPNPSKFLPQGEDGGAGDPRGSVDRGFARREQGTDFRQRDEYSLSCLEGSA